MIKNTCKVIKKNGENIILAWDSELLKREAGYSEELCTSLVEPKNMAVEQAKKHIEEVLSFYKQKKCSKDAVLRNIPDLLAYINSDPLFVQKIIFKLKKIWIDENEIWRLIYEEKEKEKEYTLDVLKDEFTRVKKNLLDWLDKKLKSRPKNQKIIEDIKFTTEYLNKMEVPDRWISMQNDIISSYVDKATSYIFFNNPTRQELEYIVSINPSLMSVRN